MFMALISTGAIAPQLLGGIRQKKYFMEFQKKIISKEILRASTFKILTSAMLINVKILQILRYFEIRLFRKAWAMPTYLA